MNDHGRIEVAVTLPGEPRLRAVIERLLRPSPAERFASAREVRNALVGPPPTAATTVAVTSTSSDAVRRYTEPVEDILTLPLLRDRSPERRRISYEFEADGTLHRDSDTVLPAIADRWQVGDRVPILYIAGRAYDSVIVASE